MTSHEKQRSMDQHDNPLFPFLLCVHSPPTKVSLSTEEQPRSHNGDIVIFLIESRIGVENHNIARELSEDVLH